MTWPNQQSQASHATLDIFIHEAFESHEAKGLPDDLHLHTMEDLLMLGGGWPVLGTVQSDWA